MNDESRVNELIAKIYSGWPDGVLREEYSREEYFKASMYILTRMAMPHLYPNGVH